MELAKRVLDHLPVGGGTPLASGLEAALSLARRNRPGDGAQKLLVVITDGTANVTRANAPAGNPSAIGRETVWRELEEICTLLRREGLESAVIDTRDRHVTGGEAKKLAGLLGGRHVHLAHADSKATVGVVAAITTRSRRLKPTVRLMLMVRLSLTTLSGAEWAALSRSTPLTTPVPSLWRGNAEWAAIHGDPLRG